MQGSCGSAEVRSGFLIPPLASQIQAVGATHAPKIWGRSSHSHTYLWAPML